MKKLALIVFSICLAAPVFAGDVVGHSVVVAGKDSGKAVTVAGKDTAKATVKAVKFLF
jgi:acyl dehydratase